MHNILYVVMSLSFCSGLSIPHQREEIGEDFAKNYLYKHGYSNCPLNKPGVCSSESLQSALMKFQNNFKLQVTGYLDEKTKEKMMAKRCNNADEQDPKINSIRRKRRATKDSKIPTVSLEYFTNDHHHHHRPVEVVLKQKSILGTSMEPGNGVISKSTRKKRSTSERKVIRWCFSNSTEVTLNYKVAALYAHKSWSEVLPLKFYNTRKNDDADVEYDIKKGNFKSYVVQSGKKTEIHLSLAGNESIEDILIHSIGHYLGLAHIMDNQSVMYPLYENMFLEIGRQEQELAQAIHGKCSGKFDLVTNWLLNNASEYVTIFTRDRHCWIYSHAMTRTLRGAEDLCIFPQHTDAVLQYFKADGSLESLAFGGNLYYKYDQITVMSDYPKQLSDLSCSSKEGPKQINAAFADPIFVYLFSGGKVWLYDKETFPNDGFPQHVVNFGEIFHPSIPGDSMDGPIDSIFHSYFFNSILIFKGEELYATTSQQLSTLDKFPRYEITKIGLWNEVYDNICEDE